MRATVLILLCAVAFTQVLGATVRTKVGVKNHKVTVLLPTAGIPAEKAGIQMDCDVLLDSMLVELDPLVASEGYDPYYFVNEDLLDFIDVTGEILGLSSIARKDNCSMTLGTTTKLTFSISVTDLIADIDMDMGGIYDASAEADFDEVDCAITADGTLPDGPFEVDTFDITYMSDCNIVLTGLGIFDYLADLIADGLCDLLDGLIADLLDGTIKDLINQLLGNLTGEKISIGFPRIAATRRMEKIHRVIPSKYHH